MTGEPRPFLPTLPIDDRHRRLALGAVLVSGAAFIAIAPFARVPLTPVPAFIPIYQSALVLGDLITAALLFGQFAILRSRGLLLLACAYLFSAFMAIAHMLTFPGLFMPTGLLGAGPQTTAWLYMLWHGGFPVAVVAYALMKDDPGKAIVRPGAAAAAGIAAVAALVVALAIVTTSGHGVLPSIMRGNVYTPTMMGVVSLVWLLSIAALALVLRRRRRSVLDLWLGVVMIAWVFDVALSAVLNAGRYDLGFYAGRIYGLAAAMFVLVVLLLENGVLYARLDTLNADLEARVVARTAELEKSREALHQMAAIGATAREQEKARLARELHDELAQSLTALKIDLMGLRASALARDPDASQRIASMLELLDETVAATRRISADLRPLMLDDLGLVPAAQWLVSTFQRRHGIDCQLAVEPPELELGDPHSTAVFRIMQESLTNIARHSGATSVEVNLSRADGEVRLKVRDNGRGFDAGSPRKLTSFGLVGLHERVHLVAGEVRIDTGPGKGTEIDVRIPVGSGA